MDGIDTHSLDIPNLLESNIVLKDSCFQAIDSVELTSKEEEEEEEVMCRR